MSGGIDSTLVAYLTSLAVGRQNVLGVIMPSQFTNSEDIADALNVTMQLGISYNQYQAIQSNFSQAASLLEGMGEQNSNPKIQQVKLGNIHARIRMIILRDIAKSKHFLVAGTSNASERLTGYATLAGDGLGGVDNEGLDQLFKTSERELAKYLGIPQSVIDKHPSAGLWQGQKDEDELGLSYNLLDQVLVGILLKLDKKTIVNTINDKRVTISKIDNILLRLKSNAHKSTIPPVAYLYK